jgi:hypothetical protein
MNDAPAANAAPGDDLAIDFSWLTKQNKEPLDVAALQGAQAILLKENNWVYSAEERCLVRQLGASSRCCAAQEGGNDLQVVFPRRQGLVFQRITAPTWESP